MNCCIFHYYRRTVKVARRIKGIPMSCLVTSEGILLYGFCDLVSEHLKKFLSCVLCDEDQGAVLGTDKNTHGRGCAIPSIPG